mmetsp:Transcript_57674/g.135823  ORF Transcript_57674/g.135823 Transcript_57674/m.135823 type:complete len:360 (+) Transcript_57674:876-1955(+)
MCSCSGSGLWLALQQRHRLAHQPAPEGQHADDEDQPGDEADGFAQAVEPGDAGQLGQRVAEVADLVLQRDDDQRSHHRPHQRAHAAHQRHQDDEAGGGPDRVGQRGETQHQGLGGAGQAGQRGREHEGQQLEVPRVVAEGRGAGLVLADGREHLAEGRVDDAVDQPERRDEQAQHDVEQRQVLRQVQPEEMAARHALQAVFPAGERRLQEEEVQHLGQRQRDHREVDARAPDRQQAEHQADECGAPGTEQQPHRRGQAPDLERMAADVARRAQEGRMPEGQQPGEAHQQVEGAGKQRVAQHLHHEHGVGAQQRQQADADEEGRVADQLLVHFSFPNKPAGRTSSTMAMTTNTTVLDASG